jgi:hypothetical protein
MSSGGGDAKLFARVRLFLLFSYATLGVAVPNSTASHTHLWLRQRLYLAEQSAKRIALLHDIMICTAIREILQCNHVSSPLHSS